MVKKCFNKIIVICCFWLFCASSCTEKPEIIYTKTEGIYACNERSAYSGVKKYIVEIDKVPSQQNTYIIANFHNLGDNEFIYAESFLDTLYIKDQVIGNIIVNGKGNVSKEFNQINLNYITKDGLLELDYYCTYSR